MLHAVADETVRIPDDELRGRIERASGLLPDAPIKTSHLAPLQVFDAASTRTSDLTGLDAAVNLRHRFAAPKQDQGSGSAIRNDESLSG